MYLTGPEVFYEYRKPQHRVKYMHGMHVNSWVETQTVDSAILTLGRLEWAAKYRDAPTWKDFALKNFNPELEVPKGPSTMHHIFTPITDGLREVEDLTREQSLRRHRLIQARRARGAVQTLMDRYGIHPPSLDSCRLLGLLGHQTYPWNKTLIPEIPEPFDDTVRFELDPIGYYQPPILVDPRESIWYWLGEPWAPVNLYIEYSKDIYRLQNHENFNQEAFMYVQYLEQLTLGALEQHAKFYLAKRIYFSLHFKADLTNHTDQMIEQMRQKEEEETGQFPEW